MVKQKKNDDFFYYNYDDFYYSVNFSFEKHTHTLQFMDMKN